VYKRISDIEVTEKISDIEVTVRISGTELTVERIYDNEVTV